jgi:hypothetical protein
MGTVDEDAVSVAPSIAPSQLSEKPPEKDKGGKVKGGKPGPIPKPIKAVKAKE